MSVIPATWEAEIRRVTGFFFIFYYHIIVVLGGTL
jgi:hypothetical protein